MSKTNFSIGSYTEKTPWLVKASLVTFNIQSGVLLQHCIIAMLKIVIKIGPQDEYLSLTQNFWMI